MTAEEFYKDHFGHTSQHVSMDKIFVCMELYAIHELANGNFNSGAIVELEKHKSMMEEVRDGREDYSLNDFIVGLGRTIEKLKQQKLKSRIINYNGSVVQLDRMSDFGSDGWGFESLRSHKNKKIWK